jgi:hypothetical protein
MSSITFDQLKDQLRAAPPDLLQVVRAALQLDTTERRELLEALPEPQLKQHPEVKVRKVVARVYSRETQ